MARTKKKLSPEEELQAVITQIAETEEQLKRLKSEKAELEAKIEETELKNLRDTIKAKGLSIEEAIAKLEA